MPFDRPWEMLWQIATSDYLLGAVFLALAVALALAAWLPQTSAAGLDSDLVWRAEVQQRFGGEAWFEAARSPLQALGAFHVADAAGFRVALALLGLALLARLVDSAERLWLTWRRGSAAAGEEGAGRLWGEVGVATGYLGALVVLLGAAVTNLGGWQTGTLPLAPGESVPLGDESDLTLRLKSLDEDGRRGAGEIWRGEETLIGAGELAVGRPLKGDGVGAYLVGSGMGLRVRATLSDTQALELVAGPDKAGREELAIPFTEEEARHLVGVPEVNLVLLLTAPEAEQAEAQPWAQVFEEGSGEFMMEQEVGDDTTLTVGDVAFALTRVPYAKVRAVHDRGAFWSQLGVVGMMAGAALWGWGRGRGR